MAPAPCTPLFRLVVLAGVAVPRWALEQGHERRLGADGYDALLVEPDGLEMSEQQQRAAERGSREQVITLDLREDRDTTGKQDEQCVCEQAEARADDDPGGGARIDDENLWAEVPASGG